MALHWISAVISFVQHNECAFVLNYLRNLLFAAHERIAEVLLGSFVTPLVGPNSIRELLVW